MAERKMPPIGFNDLPEYLHLIRRYGYGPVRLTMNSLMQLNPKEIRDLRQSFAESLDEHEESQLILDPTWDYREGVPKMYTEASKEPLPNLGDPDEESHDYVEDDHFDQEAWDRFLSEENHQRYG